MHALGISAYVHARLKTSYMVALGTMGLLALSCQLVVQYALSTQERDALLINRAGRQRMLSQKIVKEALLIERASDSRIKRERAEIMRKDLTAWIESHGVLQATPLQSELGEALLASISTPFSIIRMQASDVIKGQGLTPPESNSDLSASEDEALAIQGMQGERIAPTELMLRYEPIFLAGMDSLTREYQRESERRLANIKMIELGLFGFTLVVLGAEAYLIFRPALRHIKKAIGIIESERIDSHKRSLKHWETAGLASKAFGDIDRQSLNEQAVDIVGKFLEADLTTVVDLSPDQQLDVAVLKTPKTQTHNDLPPQDQAQPSGSRTGLVIVQNQQSSPLVDKVKAVASSKGKQDRISSTISAPIRGPQRPYGYISAHFKKPHQVKTEDQSFLCSLGNLLGIIYDAQDVRETLQDRENRLSCILEAAADAIFVIDANGKILSSNKALERILQISAADIISKSLDAFVTLTALAKTTTSFSYFLAHADLQQRYEGTASGDDGMMRPVELAFSRLSSQIDHKDHAQQNDLYVAIMADITERKAADLRISEFYSNVSHELRTPLTSIKGSLSLLEGGLVGELPKEALDIVHIGKNEAERLIRLVNDILDVRKIQADGVKFEIRVLSVRGFLDDCLKPLRLLANQKDIELETRIESQIDADLQFMGDKDRVAQVLTNLVSNAIKFAPAGSKILIQVQKTEDQLQKYIKFAVIDKGPGIAADDLHKLFKLIHPIDASGTHTEGSTGLGLIITSALIQKQGGKVGVESAIGQGSTFWFMLPDGDA